MEPIHIDTFEYKGKIYMSVYCMKKHSKYQGDPEKVINDGWRFDLFVGKYYKYL